MTEKILTISVAAYNMERYIRENLDSIVCIPDAAKIEVLVNDDGGTDRTSAIVGEYCNRFPGIIRLIHQPNGGYGTVQTNNISQATGKYFKILDGDDWMDSDGLGKLVRFLDGNDVDAVVTGYAKGPDREHLKESVPRQAGILHPDELKTVLGMWSLTFKTSLLQSIRLDLPAHSLYTDRLYATAPFAAVAKVAVLPFSVYCYRTGRDGQSVSLESRLKHIDEYLEITRRICRCAADAPGSRYVRFKAAWAYKVTVRALFLLPASRETRRKIVLYEKEIRELAPAVFRLAASPKTKMGRIITFLRWTAYIGYWPLAVLPKTWVRF